MEKIKKFDNLFLLAIGFMVSIFFNVNSVHAASLFFSPGSGTYNVGKSFSVGVYVNSAGAAANAFQGVVNFPSDKLEVTSLSKSGSIMSLWVQEPAFSAGSAHFEGIVLNPGFSGSGGKIITLNFKVKSPGSASLTFSGASVLANDGQGTNILSGAGDANFTLNAGTQPAQTQPVPAVTFPKAKPSLAPNVSSSTHLESATTSEPAEITLPTSSARSAVASPQPPQMGQIKNINKNCQSNAVTITTTFGAWESILILSVAFLWPILLIVLLVFAELSLIVYAWYRFELFRMQLRKNLSQKKKISVRILKK